MRFSFAYTGLRVLDLEKSLRFFRDGLGMKEVARSSIEETGGIIVDLESEGFSHRLELNWYPPGSRFDTPFVPGEALDHLFFSMDGAHLDEAIRHLEAHGGTLRIPPFKESGGRLAYVDSPDGATVELFEKGG